MSYNLSNGQDMQLLINNLKLKISSISYFCSPLTSIGEGGSKTHHGMMDA